MNNDILTIHDLFQIKGGGERLVYEICRGLPSDLITAAIGDNSFDLSSLPGSIQNLQAGSRFPGFKTLSLAKAFKNRLKPQKKYQQVIYSGVAAPLAARHFPAAKNLFYCHTPPRFVYDKKEYYQSITPFWQRPFLKLLIAWLQPQYERSVAQMDLLLTNSKYVQQRIETHLQITAQVLYPPCDTDFFTWQNEGDYFLSLARHDKLKRVDQIIKAFKQMPDKKLVVASGGEQTKQLKRLARNCHNIKFTGWLNEKQLQQALGSCLATIYLPLDEDFGMTPVESMSAGKPVIAIGRGGILETVKDGETGFLLPEQNLQQQLLDRVSKIHKNQMLAMRYSCEKRAKKFDKKVFIEKLQIFLQA